MEINKLYQSGHTDGHKHFYGNAFFLRKEQAVHHGKQEHGTYSIEPREVYAVKVSDGKYLVLKSPEAVTLFDSDEYQQQIREQALAKLSPEERKALGI